MPIEIRELVVRARIDPGADGAGENGRSGAPAGGREPDEGREQGWADAVVREALRALADRQER